MPVFPVLLLLLLALQADVGLPRQLQAKECKCANGTAVESSKCPRSGANVCRECKNTHKLNDAKECIYKRCICPCQNDRGQCGKPYEGENCPVYGDLKWCGKCYKGFSFSRTHAIKRCDVTECKCANGKGATGTACPSDRGDNRSPATKCGSCDWGYRLKSGKCEEVECNKGAYYNQKRDKCLKCPTGNCDDPRDCAGVPGGNTKRDTCGVCGGSGKSCLRAREAALCRTADVNGDGKKVDIEDLLWLLGHFGGKCGKLHKLNWQQKAWSKYKNLAAKGGKQIRAIVGDAVEFSYIYREFGEKHNVWQHPSHDCSSKGAKEVADMKQSGTIYPLRDVGNVTFACHKVNMQHCKGGMIVTFVASKRKDGTNCAKFDAADLDGNKQVNIEDLLKLLSAFGARC